VEKSSFRFEDIGDSQRRAAKVVGFVYLFAMALGILMFQIRSRLVVYDNAAKTAANIVSNEPLFRSSMAVELITFVSDTVLLTALYVILRPVNSGLALLAAFWRLVAVAVLLVAAMTSLDVLRLLSGADYLRAFDADRLHALARLAIGAHDAQYNVGFLFLGLGSTLFAWLWLKSNYIPRALSILGLIGSFLLAACSLTILVVPSLARILTMAYMMPLGVFEVTMGFWLLIKGLPGRRPAQMRAGAPVSS
jgi:uncharacterized protein DUF4386